MNLLWRMILVTAMMVMGGPPVWAGIADDVRESLKHGGDPNAWIKQDLGFRTHPLHLVAAAGGKAEDRVEAARLLIEAGADVNSRDDLGNTPLHEAVGALNPRVAKLLIRRGAKVNARNKKGETPLFHLDRAASFLHSGHPSPEQRKRMTMDMRALVALLSHHGADLNARNARGKTLLIHLADDAPGEVIGLLLELGARANATDRRGVTALDRALFSANDGAARQLIAHGVKATAAQLVKAISERRNANLALAMVEAGAELNGTDRVGDSPLCAATVQVLMEPRSPKNKGWFRLIDAMLARGANPKSPCGLDGGTAYSHAMRHPELSRIFHRDRAPVREQAKPSTHKGKKKAERKSPIEIGAMGVEDELFRHVDQALEMEDAALAAASIRTLPDMDAIPRRIRTLKRYVGYNRRILQLYEHGDESAWQRARDAGGSREEADAAARIYREIMRDPKMVAMADRTRANAEWAELTIRAYRLLQQNPDKWRFGRAGEKHLVVTDRDFAKRLGELSRRMKQAGARAEEAHERLRRLQKKE